MTIKSPVKGYSGITAGVAFLDGVGQTTNAYLIRWFKEHGYTVERSAGSQADKPDEQQEVETEAEP